MTEMPWQLTIKQIERREHLRQWAYNNACTLVFLSVMFVITWIVVVVANYAT